MLDDSSGMPINKAANEKQLIDVAFIKDMLLCLSADEDILFLIHFQDAVATLNPA